jgi:hypothetical protein
MRGVEPLPRAKPEDVGMASERLSRLTTVFQQYVSDGRLAGGVILVARKGKLADLQPFGFRDREAKAAMRDDARRCATIRFFASLRNPKP